MKFTAEKVADNVYWVGAIDWNVRSFHGYRTGRGTTYNAFLVIDEKVTLIDTVKDGFHDELMARVRSVIDPSKIDYIVSNHAEPDHSGCLLQVIDEVKPEKVFASPMGVKALKDYYGAELDLTPVKTGETIDLGKGKIHFAETRMIHWPDSMVSYLDSAKVLFAQDAFGMHLAGSKRWGDEYEKGLLEYEAHTYFANIINLQSAKVLELLEALPGFNFDIGIVAPDHGPLWRKPEDIGWIVGRYRDWALEKPRPHALVAYSTMWHATEKLAMAIADGIRSTGVEVKLADTAASDRSVLMTETAASGLVAFGTPTMNNQMFPAMADILTYIKGLRPKNKLAFAFGSYGWSGEGAKQVAAILEEMKLEQPIPLFQTKYMPTAADLEQAWSHGETLGRMLLAKVEEAHKPEEKKA